MNCEGRDPERRLRRTSRRLSLGTGGFSLTLLGGNKRRLAERGGLSLHLKGEKQGRRRRRGNRKLGD